MHIVRMFMILSMVHEIIEYMYIFTKSVLNRTVATNKPVQTAKSTLLVNNFVNPPHACTGGLL